MVELFDSQDLDSFALFWAPCLSEDTTLLFPCLLWIPEIPWHAKGPEKIKKLRPIPKGKKLLIDLIEFRGEIGS